MSKDTQQKQRIAKFLARSGIASRREVERMILAGRVNVNGKVLDTPAFLVSGNDKILVDNKLVGAKPPSRLWLYHKPAGLVTTNKDPEGRPTVFDNLPKNIGRVISIGRLDINSEGLLVLTNDGELARKMELPATGFSRRYRARAFGKTTQDKLDKLLQGVIIDGVKTGPIIAKLEREQGGNVWIAVTLRDGKNREVRRALETVGLKVNRLIRLSYGPFQLGSLGRGEVQEVKSRVLRDQLGHLADFSEPKTETKPCRKSGRKGGSRAHRRR